MQKIVIITAKVHWSWVATLYSSSHFLLLGYRSWLGLTEIVQLKLVLLTQRVEAPYTLYSSIGFFTGMFFVPLLESEKVVAKTWCPISIHTHKAGTKVVFFLVTRSKVAYISKTWALWLLYEKVGRLFLDPKMVQYYQYLVRTFSTWQEQAVPDRHKQYMADTISTFQAPSVPLKIMF